MYVTGHSPCVLILKIPRLLCHTCSVFAFHILQTHNTIYTTINTRPACNQNTRRAHLPEEQQPQGFFERGLNRLAASITAELATSLGYECEITVSTTA